MAYQFPDNPTLGQVYEGFAWRGSYWSRVAPQATEDTTETPEVAPCLSEELIQAPAVQPQPSTPVQPSVPSGNNNTLINLTIPIDLGQLLHGADHAHSDFDYIAPE